MLRTAVDKRATISRTMTNMIKFHRIISILLDKSYEKDFMR